MYSSSGLSTDVFPNKTNTHTRTRTHTHTYTHTYTPTHTHTHTHTHRRPTAVLKAVFKLQSNSFKCALDPFSGKQTMVRAIMLVVVSVAVVVSTQAPKSISVCLRPCLPHSLRSTQTPS